MHKPEYVLESETHKIFLGFEIQTDHRIYTRRLDLDLIDQNKRTNQIVDFAVPTNLKVNVKVDEKLDKTSPCQRAEKAIEHESDRRSSYSSGFENNSEELGKLIVKIEIMQTIALLKLAWILRRILDVWGDLGLLRQQWKKHQLVLVWGTGKEYTTTTATITTTTTTI